jgi:hypothetical protein
LDDLDNLGNIALEFGNYGWFWNFWTIQKILDLLDNSDFRLVVHLIESMTLTVGFIESDIDITEWPASGPDQVM